MYRLLPAMSMGGGYSLSMYVCMVFVPMPAQCAASSTVRQSGNGRGCGSMDRFAVSSNLPTGPKRRSAPLCPFVALLSYADSMPILALLCHGCAAHCRSVAALSSVSRC